MHPSLCIVFLHVHHSHWITLTTFLVFLFTPSKAYFACYSTSNTTQNVHVLLYIVYCILYINVYAYFYCCS